MKKIQFSLLAVFLVVVNSLHGQVNVPVDLHTGHPDITIPIYTISSGNLKLPVSLKYTPGVKLAMENGNDEYNLGVGWSLEAGGSINRIVKSLPDDYQGTGSDTRMGWLYGTGSGVATGSVAAFIPQSRTDCSGDASNYSTLNGFINNATDVEPDVFNFRFGEYSGSFMFDNNKIIQLLPYQDMKIDPTYNAAGLISGFTITVNNGVRYNFISTTTVMTKVVPSGGAANTVLYLRDKLNKYADAVTYTTSWGLSDIISPSGATVSLSYSSHVLPMTQTPTDIYLSGNSNGSNFKRSLFSTQQTTTQSLLSNITGGAVNVFFNYNNDSAINSFLVTSNSNSETSSPVMLTIALQYGQAAFRKYLTSVQNFNNCVKNPPYQFEYSGMNFITGQSALPEPYLASSPYFPYTAMGTQGQADYWGYYNGDLSGTFVPNLYIYPNEPLEERYRLYPIPGYSGTFNFLGGGADRTANPTVIAGGSLSKIIFPTGGNVKIDYESNQFVDAKTGQLINGGGVRVSAVTVNDGINSTNDIVKTYTYSGGKLINRPQFSFPVPIFTDINGVSHTIDQYGDQPTQSALFTARTSEDINVYDFDGPDVIYDSGSEVQAGKGKLVFQYANPATFPQISSPEYSSVDQWTATFSRYATTVNTNSACLSKGALADGYYGFPYPSNPNYNFERGRLQRIQMYNENTQLVKEKIYTYTPIYKSAAPAYIYGLSFDYFTYNAGDVTRKAISYARYRLYTGITKFQTNEREVTYDPGTNFASSAAIETQSEYTNLNNHTLLTKNSTVLTNDGTNTTTYNTRYKYPQDYTNSVATGPDSSNTALRLLKDMFVNNLIVEKTQSIVKTGQSELVTESILNKYKMFTIKGDNKLAAAQSRVMQSQVLGFKSNQPINNFVPASINVSGQFINDPHYRVLDNYLDYNTLGNLFSRNDGHHNLSGVHYDITRTLPTALINNALSDQVIYSSFDDLHRQPFGSMPYSFDPMTSDYAVASGRIGDAASVPANFMFQKSGVSKGVGDNYVFSCWAKSSAAGTLSITLTDASGHSISVPISYSNTTGVWVNYRVKIPVAIFNPIFNIQVNTSVAVVLDDMLFYPELAQVSLSSYKNTLKTSGTDSRGNTTFYSFDDAGRPTLTMDQDNNILKRVVYNYKLLTNLNSYFIIYEQQAFNEGSSAQLNTPINFLNGFEDPCESPGIIRNWDFGDGSILNNGGINPTHTYTVMPSSGYYLVKLTVTSATYGTVTSTRKVIIQYPHPAFNLYVCGIVEYDLCTNQVRRYGTNASGTCNGGYTLGTNVFTASPINSTCPGGGATYKWELQQDGNLYWTTLPGNTNTVTVQLPNLGVNTVIAGQSYTLRCTMTPTCNAQSVSKEYHILFSDLACH